MPRFALLPIVLLFALLAPSSLAPSHVPSAGASPGENGAISFTSGRIGGTLTNGVYTMDDDGGGQIRLTSESGYADNAMYSPDGNRIAYRQDGPGGGDIWVMNWDGTNKVNVTNSLFDSEDDPAWSPDGGTIAFVGSGEGPCSQQLFSVFADGTGRMNLTNDAECDVGPSWSPDGTKIAFTKIVPGGPGQASSYEIYVMGANGTGQTNLTNSAAYDHQPAWSPDGTRIAFSSDRDGAGPFDTDIYTMDPDGTDIQRLSGPGIDYDPAWSPDGTQIVFASNRQTGDFEVYAMNSDGSNIRQLTNSPGFDMRPNWQAVTPALETTLATDASAGQMALQPLDATGFAPWDLLAINPGGTSEEYILVKSLGSLELQAPLEFDHPSGEIVVRVLKDIRPGDADCSRNIGLADVVSVLRNVSSLSPTDRCATAGNVRCNDPIDAGDALDLLMYLAGMPPDVGDCPPVQS